MSHHPALMKAWMSLRNHVVAKSQVHGDWLYSQKLLVTTFSTAAIWIPVTLLTAAVNIERLQSFVTKIHPG